MKTYLKTLSFTVAMTLIASMTLAQDVLVDVTKTYSNISKIEVEGGWLEVKYEGTSSSEVSVEAFLKSNEADQDIIFVTVGDVLKISYSRKKNNYSWNNKNEGHIHITGPSKMGIDFKNSSGSIDVEKVSGDQTSIQVTSGRASASDIKGDLYIKASSGKLMIDGISGDVEAGITSGNTEINDVEGNVNYKSTSGSLRGSNIGGEINVQLTSGNARLNDIGTLGSLKFTSGSIKAENAGLGENTEFSGSSGNFSVQTPSDLDGFNYSLKATSGSIKVGQSSSNKKLEIDNGSSSVIRGSITSGRISIEN